MIFFQHDNIKRLSSSCCSQIFSHHYIFLQHNQLELSSNVFLFLCLPYQFDLIHDANPPSLWEKKTCHFTKPPRLPCLRHEIGENFPGLVAFTGHDHLDSLSTILMGVDRDYTNKFTSSKLRRCGRAQVSETSRWWVLNNKVVECFCDLLYDQVNHSGACSSQGIAWHNCAPMLEREKPNNAWCEGRWGVTHLK